jgi:uncharacterized protein YggT (Ycf19 family)
VTPLAIDRGDVADFVYTFALILFILVFVRVLMSFFPRIPYYRWLDVVLNFVIQVTDPLLAPFRRIPPVRLGPVALDLAPMILMFLLLIGGGIAATLIRGS